MFSLPPVWSKCQCVLITNLTGFGVIAPMAATIFGVSGANWSSTRNVASSPTLRPIFPPEPKRAYTPPRSCTLRMVTVSKFCAATADGNSAHRARSATRRIMNVGTLKERYTDADGPVARDPRGGRRRSAWLGRARGMPLVADHGRRPHEHHGRP